jgi:hypothetical protein
LPGHWPRHHPDPVAMITVMELNALADAVGDRWRRLVEMTAWWGLRFGELAAQRKNRIDTQGGTVTVMESAAVLAGGVRHVGPPKSDAGRRVIAIPPHIPQMRSITLNDSQSQGLTVWYSSHQGAASRPRPISAPMSGGLLWRRSA